MKTDTRPNVILICVDQMRGDALSIDDHPIVQTPYLDQMALSGAHFTNAYTACPSCIAARAGLFTGQSPRTHGRVGYKDGVAWDYPITMASEFTRQGYQTQAIGKMHVYPERSQVGFQNVILHDGYLHHARNIKGNYGLIDDYIPWLREQLGREADYFDHGLNCNAQPARPWDKDEYLHPTNWVVSESIDFLRRRDTRKPFFLFMSFHRPHQPYDPPAWAFEQYLYQDMPQPPVGEWHELFAEVTNPRNPALAAGKLDPRVYQRSRAGYYGLITHIDHQLNRFMELLTEYGAKNNTYVCFTSDHGEMLGDHHLYRKQVAYQGSTRVPFILTGPNGSGIQPKLTVSDAVVELRDVMPTLLDCAGLEIPSSVEGKSVLPLARGEKGNWRSYLHGEHTGAKLSNHWINTGNEKFVWFSQTGHEQIFDLEKDPQELQDLAKDPACKARVARLRQMLIDELAGREEGFTDGQKLIAGREVKPALSHILPKAQ